MENTTDFIDLFTVAICVYLLYCGVFNRGQLYKDDSIHESKKAGYNKVLRIFALLFAPVGMLSVVFQRLGGFAVLGWVLYGLCLALNVVMIVFCYRMTDQHVKKQLAKQKGTPDKKTKK